jgi:hypothetical protein
MTHRLIAAMTGHGKSYYATAHIEANYQKYPVTVVFDHKGEYTGLVEAGWMNDCAVDTVGENWNPHDWADYLISYPKTVIIRDGQDNDTWKQVVGNAVAAARELAQQTEGAFIVLDEAHLVAPEQGSYPSAISGLSTTGRGEGASSLWVTQRPALLDTTPISQADEQLFGAFVDDNDLGKVGRNVGYPEEVHDPRLDRVPGLPNDLHADEGPIPVRQFDPVGSEWIYSDTSGERERRDTRGIGLQTEHAGPEGNDIRDP